MRNIDSSPAEKHLSVAIKELIDQSRQQVSVAVNFTEIFPNVEIVHTLCSQLKVEYAKGSGEKKMRQSMTFAQAFPEKEIIYALFRQIKVLLQIISKIGHELATHLNSSVIGSKSITLTLKWLNLTTLKCNQGCKILC